MPTDVRSRGGAAASHVGLVGLLVVTAALFSGVWRGGIFEVIPIGARTPTGEERPASSSVVVTGDATLAAWLIPRNAYTLMHSPSRLFEGEHCAPAARTIAFGEPMITLGVLAIPYLLLTGDPIAAYNLTIFTAFFLSAAAMYLLIGDWSGSRAAAVIAALLYAFGAERIAGITHVFVFDTAWIVFALYFARRWLAEGRWRDVIGMAVCGAMQLGTSFYPIVASMLVAAPIAAALLATYGVRHVRISQVIVVVAVIGVAAYGIFGPFLANRAAAGLARRNAQHFAEWSWFLPHGEAGVAWTAAVLAIAALVLRGRKPAGATMRGGGNADSTTLPGGRDVLTAARSNVRWAIVAGALLVAMMAAGPHQPHSWTSMWSDAPPFRLPNIYGALSRVIPGLETVRVPARIESGYHLGICLLAGFGAASLLTRFPRLRVVLAAALIIASGAETFLLAGGGRLRAPFAVARIAPERDEVELFRTLARMDNSGPLLELPIGEAKREYVFQSPRRILLSAYHHRRTSACYGSFFPAGRERLRHDALALPATDALARICEEGFTTAVVHLETPRGRYTAEQLRDASQDPASNIRYLTSSNSMMAFGLCESGPRLGGSLRAAHASVPRPELRCDA